MKRKQILSELYMQVEQERSRGIGYWCDPDLGDALRQAMAQRAASPGPAGRNVKPLPGAQPGRLPAVAIQRPARTPAPPSPQGGAPRRFAVPPAHLTPQVPGAARSAPVQSASKASAPHREWGPPPAAAGRDPDWAAKLAALGAEAKACTQCGLCEGRNSVVFGAGGATVPLVFVGEAPGAEEDRQGLPFVGRAGELLNRIIEAIGLKRDQVYICNVLKCRPPGNRDPLPDEVGTCSPFLRRQLEILRPKMICTLGRHSTYLLTGQSGAMKTFRGQVFDYRGAKVIPTYHPAALLRNPSLKPLVWEDVQKVRSLLDA